MIYQGKTQRKSTSYFYDMTDLFIATKSLFDTTSSYVGSPSVSMSYGLKGSQAFLHSKQQCTSGI